jgi:hypothetical protein
MKAFILRNGLENVKMRIPNRYSVKPLALIVNPYDE